MGGLDHPAAAKSLETERGQHAQDHHRQRCRHDGGPQQRAPVPEQQQRERRDPHQCGAGMQLQHRLPEFGERVVAIRLEERHLPLGVGVAADEVRNLLQDEDHTDRGE